MNIYKLKINEMKQIAPLFAGWKETLLWSCLQGYMGNAWADSITHPVSAKIVTADFCFFAGEPLEELVQEWPDDRESDFLIMVPQNEGWAQLIEQVYSTKATKVTRYAIKKEPDGFDTHKLQTIVNQLPKGYEVRMIDEVLFHAAGKEQWSRDLCSQYDTYADYKRLGLGAVILHKGELVSGASSYTRYQDGIEIEIDTREDYRCKGLALVCGARLILASLERGLYPSWDAQNQGSVALAEKLGYHFDKEYSAYEIINAKNEKK